ncbi:Signal peptidase I-like protein [Haloterrigena turkmenica DSM 5511]|uniref:Signal peptidase I-like protein n=1 Tax=Haloterrigena turkmenica (strain ATCC 51198 / DSM 5511 / JCM 9101 / NCIMB 13204 / VKM B-1734 / 4k) TaxID=543526 RepID=D2RST0_HALTV|nr:S26 family signal peptidase [Haloterrigena turkmenica]ADB58904.1 Signal peptidase I-like protein [Haloterrigena turkmenica DSM 5511]
MSGSSPGDVSDDPDDTPDSNRPDDRERYRGDRDAAADPNSRRDGSAAATTASDDGVTIEDDGVVRWFLRSDDENVLFVRDVLSSVAIVAVIGLILFGVSGVWPPLVAVESPSMTPNMKTGDLIFVAEDERFVGDGAVAGTGVVTLESGQESGYEKFNNPGDVIVFQPNGNERRTPIIHRAHFRVEEGENWVETKANEDIAGDITCEDITTCPAPHDGFVTKGDANSNYDQIAGGATTTVVKSEWVTGKAMFRVPWLGNIRLTFDKLLGGILAPSPGPAIDGASSPATPDAPVSPAALAGATGLAACGGGAVTAIGRRRN